VELRDGEEELLRLMWWSGVRRNGRSTVRPRRLRGRGEKEAAALQVSRGAAAARFRVLGRGGSLLVEQRPTLACGPRLDHGGRGLRKSLLAGEDGGRRGRQVGSSWGNDRERRNN
jgi:hypothetical protein